MLLVRDQQLHQVAVPDRVDRLNNDLVEGGRLGHLHNLDEGGGELQTYTTQRQDRYSHPGVLSPPPSLRGPQRPSYLDSLHPLLPLALGLVQHVVIDTALLWKWH